MPQAPVVTPIVGRSTMVSNHPIASKLAAAAPQAQQTPSVSLGMSMAKPRGLGGRVWALLLLDVVMLAGAATLVTAALRSDRDAVAPTPPLALAIQSNSATTAVMSGPGESAAAARNAGARGVVHGAAPVAPAVVGGAPGSASALRADGDAALAPAPITELIAPSFDLARDAGAAVAPLDAASAAADAELDDPRAAAQADEIGLQSRRSQKHFDRCYTLASKGLPADQPLAGQVGVSFQIMPNGQVSSVAIDRDTTGSAQLDRCLVSEITSWHFAAGDATAPAAFVRTFRFDAPK